MSTNDTDRLSALEAEIHRLTAERDREDAARARELAAKEAGRVPSPPRQSEASRLQEERRVAEAAERRRRADELAGVTRPADAR